MRRLNSDVALYASKARVRCFDTIVLLEKDNCGPLKKGCKHSVRFCRPNGPMKLNLFTVSFGFRTIRLFQDYIPNSK